MIKDKATQYLQALSESVERTEVPAIDPAGLDDWLIVDVREDHEFVGGHVPGALSLPRSRLEMEAMRSDALEAGADKPALIYCGSGKRSLLAAETLKSLGLQRPVSLDGGFAAWRQAGYPVKKS